MKYKDLPDISNILFVPWISFIVYCFASEERSRLCGEGNPITHLDCHGEEHVIADCVGIVVLITF